MEISDEDQDKGHGSALLRFVEEFALNEGCVFCYAKLNMDEDKDLELQSFYIKNGWRLIEETIQARIEAPDPVAVYVMGYIRPRSNSSVDTGNYSATKEPVQD